MVTSQVRLRIAALGLAALMLTACFDANQQTVFDLVNQSRAGAGLPALVEHEGATAKAQAWADHLAKTGELAHSDLESGLAGVPWVSVGENVGWHNDGIDGVHRLYLESPTHADNIFGNWSHLGVGVTTFNGRTYTVHVFLLL